jgi:DNA-binding PadR family transcriptional regulator
MKHEPQTAPAAPLTTAVLHIMLALADEQRHGYSIMQEVAELSDGAVQMGPGTLYGALKRMLEDGLVEEVPDVNPSSQTDERRRFYRLTPTGRRSLELELRRLQQLIAVGQRKHLLRPH